jgi:hypothetical protein
VRLQVAIADHKGDVYQVEVFDLSPESESILSSVNTQATGTVIVSAIGEYPIAEFNVPAGKIPRRV